MFAALAVATIAPPSECDNARYSYEDQKERCDYSQIQSDVGTAIEEKPNRQNNPSR
jgi:hypothetical protein